MSLRETVFNRRWLWGVALLAAVASGYQAEARRLAPGRESPSQPSAPAGAAVPFKIHVPDEVLKDVRDRLKRTRYPDQIEDAGWDYGTNLEYLRELVNYWRDKFDWREQERRLNRFEQFKMKIDGLDVHFVHRRAKRPN